MPVLSVLKTLVQCEIQTFENYMSIFLLHTNIVLTSVWFIVTRFGSTIFADIRSQTDL